MSFNPLNLVNNNPTSIGDTGLSQSELADAVLTNVDPRDPPAMKTLVYSPDVRILIARGNKQYDVSADIISWSIRRAENSVSSIVFRLSNKPDRTGNLRYNQRFDRMDRVVMFLKRVEWVQVFSGYLDSVPHVQIYPGTVNFRASCTLKRLLHTWWDPGLPNSQGIFNQAGISDYEEQNGEASGDKGLGSMLRRLLTEVGGWKSNNIHIQKLPQGYYAFMKQQIEKLEPGNNKAVHAFERMLLGDDTSAGVGAAAGQQVGVTTGAYVLTSPERMAEVIKAVDDMGMGPDTTDYAAAQAIGQAAQGGKDNKDQPAWTGLGDTGQNWSDSALKSDAAVHCFMVVAAESSWLMYANNAVPESLNYPHDAIGSDHNSVGLFQQQEGWGSVAQRMNAGASAGMFLQKLNQLQWRNADRATMCQQVQRSGDSSGSNYKKFEAAAIEQVRSIRSGSGTGTGAQGQQNGSVGLGGTTNPTNLVGAVSAGAPTTGGLGGTTNGSPSPAGANAVIGGPKYDTAGALSFARAQIGKPYQWGGEGPASFDCSGLCLAAYRSIGIELAGHNDQTQVNGCTQISPSALVPGDLIQPHPGHIVMYSGNGMIIEAYTTGKPIHEVPINFPTGSMVCVHVPGTEYGGSPVAPFDPARAYSGGGSAPGTVATGLNGGVAATGAQEPIARNLFSYQFQAGQFASSISSFYGGTQGQEEKAFINDEPLIQTVITFAKAGLRNFASAPNGDFVAYYPDYFGLDGKGAVVNVEDIEMMNVQIDFNDDALATHVYVAGAALPNGSSGGTLGWLQTDGVATVENEWLFRRLIAAAPHVPGEIIRSGKEIMRRFGVRPLVQSMSAVQHGPMEFLLAIQIFMTKWAEQYATKIQTTFMPEIFPGMRINLVGHNLQAYVTEVTHAGDWENGFTTQMTIMAPSNPEIVKLAQTVSDVTGQETFDAINFLTNAATVFGL